MVINQRCVQSGNRKTHNPAAVNKYIKIENISRRGVSICFEYQITNKRKSVLPTWRSLSICFVSVIERNVSPPERVGAFGVRSKKVRAMLLSSWVSAAPFAPFATCDSFVFFVLRS